MSLKISPISSINRIQKVFQKRLENIILHKRPSTPDTFYKSHFLPRGTILTLLTNWLSKEDFKTIEKNKKKYDSLSKKELTELKNKKTQEYIENFKNLSLPSIEKDSKTFYHLDSSKISTKKRDSLKKIFLKIYSINCLINKETPLVLKQPLSFIFDNTNLGVPRAKLSSDIYVHPEEKASRCFGCFVKEDIHKMRKLEKEFSKKNLNQIFKLKKEILQELN